MTSSATSVHVSSTSGVMGVSAALAASCTRLFVASSSSKNSPASSPSAFCDCSCWVAICAMIASPASCFLLGGVSAAMTPVMTAVTATISTVAFWMASASSRSWSLFHTLSIGLSVHRSIDFPLRPRPVMIAWSAVLSSPPSPTISAWIVESTEMSSQFGSAFSVTGSAWSVPTSLQSFDGSTMSAAPSIFDASPLIW